MRRWILACAFVVVACKSNTPEGAHSGPDAQADADAATVADGASGDAASVANESDASMDDAGGEEGGATAAAAESTSPLPPLAKGAAWSVVRWEMSPGDVEAAFAKAGVKAETSKDAKTGAVRTTVKHGAWSAVIYFRQGKPEQIVVTGSSLSREAAASVVAKMKDRAGAPTQTTERVEVRWRKTAGSPGATTVVVANDGTVREEYVRDGATGNVGFAKLTWGMPPAAVQQALTSAGFVANVSKSTGGLDPCAQPNAPPDCAKRKSPPDVVVITKGDQEGKATFDDKGLTQLEISSSSPDKGATRLADLEKALGKPSTREHATKTTQADEVAKIDVEVKERQPEGTSTIFETYRPKK